MVNFLNLPYSGKVGQEIKFEATTSNFTTDTLIFNWDFGDGATTTTNSPFATHVYNATGTFTLILSVQGGDQSASASTTVEIKE
jgi:PKD repeat protein